MTTAARPIINALPPQRKRDRYPQYTPSGVAWLGEMPSHWVARRLKFLLASPLQYGANEAGDDDTPDQPRFIRITDIDANGNLRTDTFRSLPEELAKPYLLKQSDVLLARSGATVGKSFFYRPSWGRAAYAGYLIRARLSEKKVLPEYIHYFTQSNQYWQWIDSAFIQATIQNVSADKYANLVVPVPPLEEQSAIAAFLDRETAMIDDLIAKNEIMLRRLHETRLILISRAVNIGITPDVALVQSSIPWLGRIPSHWQIKRLKHFMKRIEQGWSPQCDNRPAEPGEWGVLKVGCMNSGTYDELENKVLPNNLMPEKHYEVRLGDVLMSRSNTAELVGAVGRVRATQGRIMVCDKLYRIVFAEDRLSPDYAVHLLRSISARQQIERDATGASASMKNISNDRVENLLFAIPNITEQIAILEHIEEKTKRIDALIGGVKNVLARLKQYRATLISTVVTGQIDVRNYRPEATCQ